jgi:putative transposase
LLPVYVTLHRFGGGWLRVSDRHCANAIFYVLRTECQGEALNQTELCPKSTAHERFQQWVAADVFLKLWQTGVAQFDELQGIDWNWLSMDGAMTKAPLDGCTKPLTMKNETIPPPPSAQAIWVYGHYNPQGKWVPGRWIE